MAGDIDVRLFLLREARALEVYAGVTLGLLFIVARSVGDGVVLDPLHLGDGQLQDLILRASGGVDFRIRQVRKVA